VERDGNSAVVLIVDRLGAGYLGPYGNTWIGTPHWNRLAVESFLGEFALTDCPQPEVVYRSYWQGLHALCPDTPSESLPECVRRRGVRSALLTDAVDVAERPIARQFDERIVLPPLPAGPAAGAVEQTAMAQTFAAAIEWLEAARGPFLLWIHCRGMDGPWDAPWDFRQQFADEEDPVPPVFVEPPVKRLEQDYDPDEVLGLRQAYAGQVSLSDVCLSALLDAAEAAGMWGNTLLAVTSPRGYPLGEHGCVGPCDAALHGEVLHVPWLLRLPDGAGAAVRSRQLIQPPDLFATLADWWQLPLGPAVWGRSLLPVVRGAEHPHGDRAAAVHDAHRAVRTPAWFLSTHPDGRRELYAKPDDRWEANEVSGRCLEAVDELELVLDQLAQAAQHHRADGFPPLSALLREGLD
jgi:hypothetical protein